MKRTRDDDVAHSKQIKADHEPTLTDIPSDVILTILSFLELNLSRYYWKFTKENTNTKKINDHHFKVALQLFYGYIRADPQREPLLLFQCINFDVGEQRSKLLTHKGTCNDFMYDDIMRMCVPRSVTGLSLSHSRLYSTQILPQFKQLTYLHMPNACDLNNFESFLRTATQLRYLMISSVNGDAPIDIRALLAVGHENLTFLSVSGVSDDLCQLDSVLPRYPKLQFIRGDFASVNSRPLKHDNIREIFSRKKLNCKYLKELPNLKGVTATKLAENTDIPNVTQLRCAFYDQSTLAGEISHLTSLYIASSISKELVKAIALSTTLTDLRIESSAASIKKMVKYFTNSPVLQSLKTLSVNGHQFTNEMITVLLQSPALTQLRYHRSLPLKENTYKLLANHDTLTELTSAAPLTTRMALHLLKSTKLKRLDIKLTVGPSAYITELSSTITDLSLGNFNLDSTCVSTLFGNNSLQSLTLWGVRPLCLDWSALRDKTSLTSLVVNDSLVEEQMKSLKWLVTECDHIQELQIEPALVGVRYSNE
jgi:hypothetical protein